MNFGMTFVELLIWGERISIQRLKFELDNNSNKFEISNWLINITKIGYKSKFWIMSLLQMNRLLYYKSQLMRWFTKGMKYYKEMN
jgi:hypothetical protein